MEASECPKCRTPLPAETREKLGGLCLKCLSSFVLADEEAERSGGGDGLASGPGETLPLELGSSFEGLQVLGLIARGGMGVVYRALQPDLNRVVALKVLFPELAADPEFAQRFNREAQILAVLSHPNIVQVFHFGRSAELYYLVMEYVEGQSLRQLIRERRLSSDETLKVLSQICTALEYAHQQGVVHRDIKPENILIDPAARVKIADFGLAKIMLPEGMKPTAYETQLVMGTPQYMAPEQSEPRRAVDHRADLYALGVILYEMLTGAPPRIPFRRPSEERGLDRRLDRIVLKALEPEPGERYQKASDLKTDLDTVAATPPGRLGTGAGRRRLLALAGIIGILAVTGGLAWVVLGKGGGGGLLPGNSSQPRPLRNWQWENPAPGSGTVGDDLVFTPGIEKRMSEAVPVGSVLGKHFHLRFSFRYQIEPQQQPWLFLIMEATPGSGHERNGVILFPESDHTIHFASRVTGKGWGLRDWRSLPPGTHGPDRWFGFDLFWEDSTKRLRAQIDTQEVFNAQLGVGDSLHGVWSIGLAGSAKELRIRDVWVDNRP